MATCQSEWFKEQARSPQTIALPDPYEIRKKIDREQPWESLLSTSFLQRYKILEICGVSPPSPFHDAPNLPYGPQLPPPGAGGGLGSDGPEPAPALGRGDGSSGRRNNTHFNAALFGSYKNNPARSSEIRRKIRSGEIPALPASKVDGGSMCLTWHTKGQCNLECPRHADHIQCTSTEYQPLCTLCTSHYPSCFL